MIMSYLPVLKVNKQNSNLNSILKSSYDTLIQDLIKVSLDQNVYLLECYELSLLSYLHPIFDENQKIKFRNQSILLRNALFQLNNSGNNNNNDNQSSNSNNSFSWPQTNSNQNQNQTNSLAKLEEFDPSLNRTSGFYSKSIDHEELKNNENYDRKGPPTRREHNFFVDENERSSSLNISLHMESSNSNGLHPESKINEEDSKIDDPNRKNDENLKIENRNLSEQRTFKHPLLKNTRSLPMWNRSFTSNTSNNQNPSLTKG